jgi:hypothetical protein
MGLVAEEVLEDLEPIIIMLERLVEMELYLLDIY